jgi:ankyrin repeat protein
MPLGKVTDTINYLVQNGDIENALSIEGIRFLGADSLHIACEKGYPRIVEKLLKENVFMGVEKDNQRPLHVACHLGHYDVVDALLRYSAANLIAINALNETGQTPLDLVPEDRTDIILLLEGYGAKKTA